MAAFRAVALLGVLLLGLGAAQAAPAKPKQTFPVADVIAQVKKEIAASQGTTGANVGITLQKVQLDFALTSTTDANGKLSVGIPLLAGAEVGGSGEGKNSSASSLSIELTPPKGNEATMSGTDTKDLGITKAIVDTRTALLQGMDQQPKLIPNKVTITLKFVVTRTGGATGQIKFLVFTLGGGTTLTSENSNTITLTFAKAGP